MLAHGKFKGLGTSQGFPTDLPSLHSPQCSAQWCPMESPMLMVALQPVGALKMWFGKQIMEKDSLLKLIQGTEGNRSKSFLF